MFVWLYRTSKMAIKNFWRNLWLSVMTIFILFLTLFFISIVVTLNLAAQQAISAIKEKVDIDVFFIPDTAETNILEVEKYLEQSSEIKEVIYTSQTDALEAFKKEHEKDSAIVTSISDLEENPLPASLTIKANGLEDYDKILTQLEATEYYKFVQNDNLADHKLIIDNLSAITRRIYEIGIVVSLIFIFFSVIMVFNTIRIAIYSHRDELSIMRLVGATNGFIRGPFFIEGVLYALISSLITMLILYPLFLVISPYINHLFTGYNFDVLEYFQQYIYIIFAIQLLISLILSAGSSMLAIGRYLKK